MTSRVFKFACSAFLLLALAACTGSQHRLVSLTNEEIGVIKKEMAANKSIYPMYARSDAANRALLARVHNRLLRNARPLCEHTGYPSCFFQTVYNSGDTINAYASENYKITFYKGLLQYLRNDEEVAMVLSHEMGHHLANHNQEKLQNAQVGAAVSGILTAVLIGAANANNPYYTSYQQQRDQKTISDMMSAGAAIGALSYSVEEEREADLLGQYLLSRSGYNLKKAEGALWVMASQNASSGMMKDRSAFGDSHPASPERIAAWRKSAVEIKENPKKLPYKIEKAAGRTLVAEKQPESRKAKTMVSLPKKEVTRSSFSE